MASAGQPPGILAAHQTRVARLGYLDELKRQAEAAKAQQSTDFGALDRNTQLVESVCASSSRYFGALAQQLNVLQPISKLVFRFDNKHSFTSLKLCDFSADTRQRKLRGTDVFDFVLLRYNLKTGSRLSVAKDFPPEIEKLEAKLRQCGALFHSDQVRSAETGRFVETRFEIRADFRAWVKIVPDHDSGWLQFQLVNLDGFETVSVSFPAFEVGSARLDELARWIVGEPNTFLRDGQHLRRVAL